MRRRSSLGWWLTALFSIVALPTKAHAHSTVAGAGDFVNGLLHPLTALPHVLIIVGLGLTAGRQTPENLKAPFWTFAFLSAIALAFTTTGWITAVYPSVLIGLALGLGGLLALEIMPPPPVSCAIFAVAALGMGLDSAVEPATVPKLIKLLFGTWISLNVLVFDIAIYVTLGARREWLRIALRIAGAWLIAISLMVLAFSLRR